MGGKSTAISLQPGEVSDRFDKLSMGYGLAAKVERKLLALLALLAAGRPYIFYCQSESLPKHLQLFYKSSFGKYIRN